MVDFLNEFISRGVDFHRRIVDLPQSVENLKFMYHCGVRQHRDLRVGIILVAQGDGVVDDLRKFRVDGGLAIAAEGDGVDVHAIVFALLQLGFQGFANLFR